MTETTRLSKLNLTQPSTLEDVSEAASESATSASVASTHSDSPHDTEQAVQIFLKHYEVFVEASVENPMVWQSHAFSGDREANLGMISPWMILGVLGVGGTGVLVAANALWLHNDAPPASLQTLPLRKDSSKTPIIPANQIAPSSPDAEFSPPVANFDRIQVQRIVSPSIRAPLPGQVIRQQGTTIVNSVPASVIKPKREAVQPQKPPEVANAAKSEAPVKPAETVSASTTPMPPQVEPAKLEPAKLEPAKLAPVTRSPDPASSAQSAAVHQQIVKILVAQVTASRANQQVFSAQVPQPLKQSISSAKTLDDFLQLSPKIPEMDVAIVSLTPQAASAVAEIKELKDFQVFRFSQPTYQKAWALLTHAKDQNTTSPAHGFIDYQQRAIVLVSL
jgi:hypothetical protein